MGRVQREVETVHFRELNRGCSGRERNSKPYYWSAVTSSLIVGAESLITILVMLVVWMVPVILCVVCRSSYASFWRNPRL
jgi:hypothetical protein